MKKGFSLVELLVSMSIIVILSTIGVQSFVAAQKRAKLNADVLKVTTAIRQAQNRALAPSRSDLPDIRENEKICSMGVTLTSNSIYRFYTTGDTGSCSGKTNYSSEIKLSDSSFVGGAVFEFSVPFATTARSVVIELNGTDLRSTITVTSSGIIKVE